nr:EOG090X06W9 [Triops cancriformis]
MEGDLTTKSISVKANYREETGHAEHVTEFGCSSKADNEDSQDIVEDTEKIEAMQMTYRIPYQMSKSPALVSIASLEFENCFTKGCKWAPDGSCLVTSSDDNVMRLFNLPPEIYNFAEWNSVVQVSTKGLVYDYAWYPPMNSADPVTCCLITTSQNNPIHMWDAYTGELRCSYRAFNDVDEITAAYSVAFDPSGAKIYCGFDRCIRIFDVSQPGRDCVTRNTKSSKGALISQVGIISCIAINPAMPSLYAAGSYLRSIGVYTEPDGTPLCLLNGQSGGITHLLFSPDGTKLFSGGRKDNEILGWDLRNPGKILHVLQRTVDTNQRVFFDLDNEGRYLFSGNSDGVVRIWDLWTNVEVSANCHNSSDLILQFEAHQDCANGLSLHPTLPLIATSSGQRHFPEVDADDSSELLTFQGVREENCVKLWLLN